MLYKYPERKLCKCGRTIYSGHNYCSFCRNKLKPKLIKYQFKKEKFYNSKFYITKNGKFKTKPPHINTIITEDVIIMVIYFIGLRYYLSFYKDEFIKSGGNDR